MRLINPDSPDSLPAGTALVTTGPHPHVVTADCPVGCLTGLVPTQVINALTSGLYAPQPGQPTLADLAAAHRRRSLRRIPGLGEVSIAAIERHLSAAGLIRIARQEEEPKADPDKPPVLPGSG